MKTRVCLLSIVSCFVVVAPVFAGLTLEEAASAEGISVRTAHRYWAYAKAWLHDEIAAQ